MGNQENTEMRSPSVAGARLASPASDQQSAVSTGEASLAPTISAVRTQSPLFRLSRELYDWAGTLLHAVALLAVLLGGVFSLGLVRGSALQPVLDDAEVVLTMRLTAPHTDDIVVLRGGDVVRLSPDMQIDHREVVGVVFARVYPFQKMTKVR